jgi:hypothetical protein
MLLCELSERLGKQEVLEGLYCLNPLLECSSLSPLGNGSLKDRGPRRRRMHWVFFNFYQVFSLTLVLPNL